MPIHAHVNTFVEFNPLPTVPIPGDGVPCGCCKYDNDGEPEAKAAYQVSPTGPNALPMPPYYVCAKHARELYEGE